MKHVATILLLASLATFCHGQSADDAKVRQQSEAGERFEQLADRYINEFAKFSPVAATGLGDHRFDDQLDNVDADSREQKLQWTRGILRELNSIPREQLSRADQVDAALLAKRLEFQTWKQLELREWSWNPLIYTGLSGTSIYSLMARDFAPVDIRLKNVISRLTQIPRFLQQVRTTLDPQRVPAVHAKTAAKQNRGMLKIIENMIEPRIDELTETDQVRLRNAIDLATEAIETHQKWIEETLIPAAQSSYRLPVELYDQKLAFTMYSPLSRSEIRAAAESRIAALHRQMFELAAPIYRSAGHTIKTPVNAEHFMEVIRFALERAYEQRPAAGEVVAVAKETAKIATDFIRERDLISLMPDPLEITLMPEFRRGVSMAYCDSPGPLDTGQKTFYVVSPIPDDWTTEQTNSFLREYNTRSLHVLTIHEALPGHYLQLAHSNRYEGRLRHLLSSGAFIEGWACYTEWMMCEAGYLNHDPLMKLITLKWYLRDAMNAIIDSAVHIDGISRDEAMRRMMDEAFQEEREAAGKWTRAQLTSVQLSTYFVGYTEHVAMRDSVEKQQGSDFNLKQYHDEALSYGTPPVQFVRALMLNQPIPQ